MLTGVAPAMTMASEKSLFWGGREIIMLEQFFFQHAHIPLKEPSLETLSISQQLVG